VSRLRSALANGCSRLSCWPASLSGITVRNCDAVACC
jgi:hypothetical protein